MDFSKVSKPDISRQVARLKPTELGRVYDMISHLPHSSNTQGYFFDLDHFPEETVREIWTYLQERQGILDDFIRNEKERIGLVYQFKKAIDNGTQKRKGEKIICYDADSDDENDDDAFDQQQDDDCLDVSEIGADDDEDFLVEKDDSADEMDDLTSQRDFDALVEKCNKARTLSRKHMGSSYYIPGRWKGGCEFREIDELMRREQRSLLQAPLTRRSVTKKSSSVKRSRLQQKLEDVLEREEYTYD